MMMLNKEHLIYEAFENYKLTKKQVAAIKSTVDGYIELIKVSKDKVPADKEVKILVDLIKSNLVNTLNVLEMN
ncbi:hypothetical protein CMI38_06590 [Candidatus Pacearchaeota archaeon]|jgi:hypothetical protein|nr:hypothetical protein [Candidatus Pacearchaeota archaeon]MAH07887.1 hypothetical protein [Candidatus Pacearchaeota archaeon]|tara:strand:+ start:2149 stop:2367 length:219 start_codon:yes stop_codon:yes gene_type:complete